MRYLSLKEQLLKERQKNAALAAEAAKNAADIDYIAMMCDVELEALRKTGTENKRVKEG